MIRDVIMSAMVDRGVFRALRSVELILRELVLGTGKHSCQPYI